MKIKNLMDRFNSNWYSNTKERIRVLKYKAEEIILYVAYREYIVENVEGRMTDRGKHENV